MLDQVGEIVKFLGVVCVLRETVFALSKSEALKQNKNKKRSKHCKFCFGWIDSGFACFFWIITFSLTWRNFLVVLLGIRLCPACCWR